MSIYRGTGGASSTTSSANVEAVLEASVQATNAAAAASTSETNAASSAASASTSAANAAALESGVAADAAAASASATAASSSASAASTSASNASTSETNASNSASAASTSASNAATSETNAAASASAASTSASNAATSETNASASASAASTSASNAATSETNAAASAASAEAAWDSFDDRYLGAKASDPALDNDGNALLTGALYYNTTSNGMKVYTGSVWNDAAFDVGTALFAADIGVTVQGYDADTAKLDVAQTYTAKQTFGTAKASVLEEGYATFTSTTNAATVDTSTATVFSHTLTENTTLTFSNPPATGTAYGMTIKIVQDAGASGYTVTWPASVDWAAATAPTLTATASAVDVFTFYTHDGGLNWYGFVAGQAMA